MTNKEKFLKLVSDEQTDTLKNNRKRIANREMLRESQRIALKVLIRLDELGMTQKQLAEKMCVSPQQVNKIVKGQENLTLETIVKLQNLLDLPLLASYAENYTKITKQTQNFQMWQNIEISLIGSQRCNYESSVYLQKQA